jgi:SAM-dependent methyltransferase
VVGDGGALPFRARAFDAVVLNNIVEHVQDPGMLLREAGRAVRDGGAVVVSTPNRLHPRNVLRLLFGRPLEIRHATHVQEFTPREMQRLAGRERLARGRMLYDPPPLIPWTDPRAPLMNLFIAVLRLLRPRGFCYNAYYRFEPSRRIQGESSAPSRS